MKYLIRFIFFWRVALCNLAFAQFFVLAPIFTFLIIQYNKTNFWFALIGLLILFVISLASITATLFGCDTWETYTHSLWIMSRKGIDSYEVHIKPTAYCTRVGKRVAIYDFKRLSPKTISMLV